MINMFLSIIIPVYNVSKYLRRCLDSIISQRDSMAEFEMILVDDGSTDDSGKICDEYGRYEYITVIHKKNEGLGFARNSGLEWATGEYVFFVDSDDAVPDGTLVYLYEKTREYNADVISFPYLKIDINQKEKSQKWACKDGSYSDTMVYGHYDILEKYITGGINCSAWSHWFKRSIFEEERFCDVPIHEDAYSMFLFLYKAENLLITSRECYIYYIRPDSLTNAEIGQKNLLAEVCEKRMMDFLDNKEELKGLHDKGMTRLISIQMMLLNRILGSKKKTNFEKEIIRIRKEIIGEAKSIDSSLLGKGQRKRVFLLEISDRKCRIYFVLQNIYQKIGHIYSKMKGHE